MNSYTWEMNTKILMARCSVLDVLGIQLSDFEHLHKCKPEIVFMARCVQPAFVREVVKACKMGANAAVAEPVWYDRVPILFNNKETNGDYMVLRNSAVGKERRL